MNKEEVKKEKTNRDQELKAQVESEQPKEVKEPKLEVSLILPVVDLSVPIPISEENSQKIESEYESESSTSSSEDD